MAPVVKTLVIVESPAKARTIGAFLGSGYVVESSIGHIRDLPRRASDVPAKFKKEPWARLGVDVDNDFKPLYVLDPDKKAHIGKLKQLIKESGEVLLATDEDREGESIAWHLMEVLQPKVPVKRMVFHEITEKAIRHAIDNPRDIDRRLVDAQEARRILDRLYGYEVSPVLWKKVMPRLSAGRVQSVATRMIVTRERERVAFVAANYWSIAGQFGAEHGDFEANLIQLDGQRIASGRDFDDHGKLKGADLLVLDEARAQALSAAMLAGSYRVASLVEKPYKRSPSPPFMTSTLQQEAGRKLRFGAARTMRAAQRLYENGFITYMRTDSTTLADSAVEAARRQIEDMYGAEYLPESPRSYRRKVKNAQEAHEAIRPTGDRFRTPEEVAAKLDRDEAKLYELVWKRTLASQMQDARGMRVQLRLEGQSASGDAVVLSASGNTITFPGFLRAYVEGSDDPGAELENRERHLPQLREGEAVSGEQFEPRSHDTQPAARYTEASLVHHLEELGVGRPSTYASIIKTIVDRGYVWKKGTALVPSFKAFAVVTLLEKHFGGLVDYAFTARMEDELDEIAQGTKQTVPWLRRFYFGDEEPPKPDGNPPTDSSPATDGSPGLRAMVNSKLEEIDARQINTLRIGEDDQGRTVVVRVGRFGPYLQRGEETANLPEDMPPDELTIAKACEMLEAPSGDRTLGADPETGLQVLLRDGRFGSYVQLGEAEEDGPKPKTQSLLRTMTAEAVTLADALKLLALPRELGKDAEGQPIEVHNGRYGPYLACGKERRSLENDDDLFNIDLKGAVELLAKPRTRGRRASAEPLRELGADPVSGGTITLRQGRFGPYVTDGETNASLRTGDMADSITPERAHELLQLRRERGPAKPRAKKVAKKKTSAKKKTAKKAAGDKAPADKSPAKKVAKKKTAKKAGKKKTAKKSSAKKTAAKKTAGKEVSNSSPGDVRKAHAVDVADSRHSVG